MACPNPSFWMMHLKVCFGIFDRSKQTITGFFSWDLSNTSNAFSPFVFWLLGPSTDYLIFWLFDYWVQDQVLTVRRSCQRPSSVSTSISSSFAPFIALEEESIYPENILFSPKESNFPLHYPGISLHFSEIIFFFLMKNWNVPLIALEYPSLPWNKPSFFLGYFFLSFSKETSIVPFIALQYKNRTVFIHLNPKILARLTSAWVAFEKLSNLKVWGLWEKEKGGKIYLWKKFKTEFSKKKKSWNKEFCESRMALPVER